MSDYENCVMRRIEGGSAGLVGVGKGGSAPPLPPLPPTFRDPDATIAELNARFLVVPLQGVYWIDLK